MTQQEATTEVTADRGTTAAQRLRSPAATDLALGIEARSRALLSEGKAAEELYREAIGMAAFVERAGRELMATGEPARGAEPTERS